MHRITDFTENAITEYWLVHTGRRIVNDSYSSPFTRPDNISKNVGCMPVNSRKDLINLHFPSCFSIFFIEIDMNAQYFHLMYIQLNPVFLCRAIYSSLCEKHVLPELNV